MRIYLRYWTYFSASRQNRSATAARRSSCYTFGAWLVNDLANIFSQTPTGANKSRVPPAFRSTRPLRDRLRRKHCIAGSKSVRATAK